MSLTKEQAAATLETYIRDVRNRTSSDDARKRAARQIRDLVNVAKQGKSTNFEFLLRFLSDM